MMGATFMNMSNTPPVRRRARRVSMQEVMQVHQAMCDEAPVTDLMVYRQPLSDVPVPASWRPSSPAPLDPVDFPPEAPESLPCDDEAIGGESGPGPAPLLHPERATSPRRIADRRSAGRVNMTLVVFAAVTCSVLGWVAMR